MSLNTLLSTLILIYSLILLWVENLWKIMYYIINQIKNLVSFIKEKNNFLYWILKKYIYLIINKYW